MANGTSTNETSPTQTPTEQPQSCQIELPEERECPNCGLEMRLWAGFYRCRNCGFKESCCF
jgi:predicted RNA-binding Zn-ribbon protein involved in translation (DUF1610 family)